jgi:hypothetical protein
VVFDTTSRWTDGAVARGAPLEAGVVLLVAGVTLWHLAREGAGFMLKAYGEYFVPQLNTDEHISIHRTLPDAARLQPDQKTHVDPIQAAALIAMAELAVDQLMLSGARLMVALDHYCDLHQKAEALLQYHFYSHPKMAFKYIAYWNGRRFDSWRMENDGRNELTLDWVEHVESDLYDDPDIQALCMLVERLQYKQSFLQEIINSPTGAASAGLDTMT